MITAQRKTIGHRAPGLTALLLGGLISGLFAETTPSLPPIALGMSTALTGPAADLGLNMRSGVLAALDEVNRSGGIHGHRVELISLDDGYEPTRTAPNMRQLIDQSQVLAVIGNVGTPTAIVAIPIANETKTPFVGAFTGAGVLRRTPPDRYVINFRASYAEETAAMVDGLINSAHFKPEEVAFFTQRDAYGDSGFAGGIAALQRYGLTNENAVAHVRYERNTVAVEKALAELLNHEPQPKAIIMVGAYAPCAAFIRLAQENGLSPLFLNVSFVGPASLAHALGAAGEGVIVTQVVPHFDSELPLVRQYRAAQHANDSHAEFSFGSLEGYISAHLLCRALQLSGGEPDRERLTDALLHLGKFDLGLGDELLLSPEEHQASHRVWPTILRAGHYVPFEWKEWEKPATPST